MSVANFNNNFENFGIKDSMKFEENKFDVYNKQKAYICKTERIEIPVYIPVIGKNLKNQVEELQKLHTEVSMVEDKIKELDWSRNMKLAKVN
jgi:hypothetical protein